MRIFRALFQVYWRAVRGRCMTHGVPMELREAKVPTSWNSTELVCPLCESDRPRE